MIFPLFSLNNLEMDKKFTNRIQLHNELDRQNYIVCANCFTLSCHFPQIWDAGLICMRLGNYLLLHKPDSFDCLEWNGPLWAAVTAKNMHNKWFVINRNGLIIFWRTVYLISRDLFKIQMDKSPLVKVIIQTKNGLYNSETACVATLVELIQ